MEQPRASVAESRKADKRLPLQMLQRLQMLQELQRLRCETKKDDETAGTDLRAAQFIFRAYETPTVGKEDSATASSSFAQYNHKT